MEYKETADSVTKDLKLRYCLSQVQQRSASYLISLFIDGVNNYD